MKPCVLIPSYNSGQLLRPTLAAALAVWEDVFVVIDGSTDGSDADLESLGGAGLRIHRLPVNLGKGAAVLEGISLAQAEGFTHALTMDSDGQHPADHIRRFIEAGKAHPEALVLGEPVFDASAPALRVKGRRISNWWANLETGWWGIHDSLFGMRLYPIAPLREVFSKTAFARRFDFDPEVAVRLCWRGVPVINLKTPVRYLTAEEGGVSQFRYLRDNTLLTGMHIRLFFGFVVRIPALLWRGRNPLRDVGSEMITDKKHTIVEEVRAMKEANANRDAFDVARIIESARIRQEKSGRTIIRQEPTAPHQTLGESEEK